jgi:hypothetical protein
MTTRQAWAIVESTIVNSGLPFLSLGLLPGIPGAELDDNIDDPSSTPGIPGIRMSMQSGSAVTVSSPGGTKKPLVFSLDLQVEGGSGNGLVQDYPDQLEGLFLGRSFISSEPGAKGAIYCTRTKADFLGRPADGRGTYRVLFNVVFDNYSYSDS